MLAISGAKEYRENWKKQKQSDKAAYNLPETMGESSNVKVKWLKHHMV